METGTKRSRSASNDHQNADTAKRQKRGFRVGPENLPDGTYRRRVQKIKSNLIDKAKIRKEYAKTKQKMQQQENDGEVDGDADATEEAPPQMHPDRQTLLEEQQAQPHEQALHSEQKSGGLERINQRNPVTRSQDRDRRHRPKPMPYGREARLAEQHQREAEERRKAREEAAKQRDQKIQERERFRKAMAKARQPGKDGKRRLGRESKVLLERVQKMVAD